MHQFSMTFRVLDADEEKEFRSWARENYEIGGQIKYGIWHPSVCDECEKMNLEDFRKRMSSTPFGV